MTNKLNIKSYFDILLEAKKNAVISLGINYLFLVGLVMADDMYQQTLADVWGVVIVLLLCLMAISIILISVVYLFIFRKKILSSKTMSVLFTANIMYFGLMLIIFPMLYQIHERSISGSEWGSDLLLILIQGIVLLVGGLWMLVLGAFCVWTIKKKKL